MGRLLLLVVLILVVVPATAVCLNRLCRSFYHAVVEEQQRIDLAHPQR